MTGLLTLREQSDLPTLNGLVWLILFYDKSISIAYITRTHRFTNI